MEQGSFWVQHGLLYRLTPEADLPSVDTLLAENNAVWDTYHNPTDGILARYNHLMLSDIRDVYSASRNELGKLLLKSGKTEEAKHYFSEAISYGGDSQLPDAYTYFGLASLFLKQCDEALEAFSRAEAINLSPDKNIFLYQAVTFRDCKNNATEAATLFSAYEKLHESGQTPLGIP